MSTILLLKAGGKNPPRGVQGFDDDTWLVPVLRGLKFEDANEAEAFLLADNRLSEIGGWNQDLLADMLSEIVDIDGAIEGIGFDYAEILDMIAVDKPNSNIDEEREAKEEGQNFLILVVCDDEDQQSDLLEELMGRGVQCKGVIE